MVSFSHFVVQSNWSCIRYFNNANLQIAYTAITIRAYTLIKVHTFLFFETCKLIKPCRVVCNSGSLCQRYLCYGAQQLNSNNTHLYTRACVYIYIKIKLWLQIVLRFGCTARFRTGRVFICIPRACATAFPPFEKNKHDGVASLVFAVEIKRATAAVQTNAIFGV